MRVLFCSLEGDLISNNVDLNRATSEFYLPPLHLLSKDTAVAFLENEDDADAIIRKGVLIIGSFSLVFTSGVDKPSSFIEIRLSDSRCEPQIIEIIRQTTRGKDILISSRKHVLLLEFKNSLEAIESHEELLAMTRIQDGFGSLNLVAIADFCQITCRYHKKRDLLDLQLDVAQAIEDLRDVVSDWLQRPTIVAISHLGKDVASSIPPPNEFIESSIGLSTIANEIFHGESTIVGITIICPTNLDCRVLAEAGVINLRRGDTIIVEGNNNDTSERSKRLLGISATEDAASVKRDVGSHDKTISNEQELQNINAKSCKQIRTNLTLDLECYAIANYFKLLIKWGQEVDILEAAGSLMPCDDGRQEISEECNTMLIWGEDSTRADGVVRRTCSVNVILENKAKNYGLVISSFCSKEAEARLKRMRNLAAIAVSMRQTIPMRDWCPQHREAINESDALRDILNKTKSAVLFHESKDKVISADVVGLTEHDQITVRLFLEALIPRQAEWIVPQESISDYTASSWIDIRRIFAIKLDIKGGDKRGTKGISGGQKNSKALKVWGFEPAMEKALKFILTPSTRKDSIPYIQKVLTSSPSITLSRKVVIDRVSESLPGRKDSNTDLARSSKVCPSDNQGKEGDVRMKNPLSLDIARLAVKDKTQFVGHFVFLDREAGMLYQSFEFEFQTYLQQKYNVMMRCSLTTASESGVMENSVSSGHCKQTGPDTSSLAQFWTPALKVEYTGSNKADIISVRTYMEKIGSTSLSRQQIHFPRYDATRYRELYNQKTKQEANLRLIRRHSTNQFKIVVNNDRDEEPKTTGYLTTKRRDEYTNTAGGIMPDPLVTVGFINIRIRPPLHSRGIRRMTFPAEVTVTICSPVNTSPQLADYTTLCEHFSSMDSHYITASVEMPLASKLAKEIIVRATRNEFVAKYGLVSLRWDENIQRRDSANGNYQDGSVDETITDSCSNSSQDECKKSDLQMGVAKLWATRPEVMRNALDRLCKSDGVIISVSMGDDIRREAINSDSKALIQTSLAEILPLSSSVGKYRLSSPNRLSATLLSPGRQSHEPRNSGERIFINNENDVSNHLGSSPSDSPTEDEDALSKKSLRPVPPGFETSSISPAKSTKDLFDFDCDDSGCSSSHSTSESFDDVTVSSKINRVQYNADEVDSHAKDVDDSKIFRDGFQSNLAIPSIDFYRSFNQEVKPTLQPLGVKIAMPKFHDIDHLTCLLTSTQPQEKTAAETSVEDKLSSNSFWSEHTSLPRYSEKSPFAIAAAPGLTIPTDWDFILQKAGLSSSIPSALTLPYPSKKLHPQTVKEGNSTKNDTEQLLASSQYTSTESYLTTGFLPTFPFGAAHTPRGAGIDGHLQDDLLGDPSTLFPTRSHRDTDARSFSFDSSSNQCSYGRNDLGPSIFNDSLSLGRRKSLDLGDIATGVARQIRPYDQHSESRQYMLPQFDGETNTLSNHYSHYQLTLSRQQQLISNVTDNRFVVHWPHPSFRFMFLVDPLKYQLSDLLHKFRARGVDVSTPFRDKSSPSACLVIDGTQQGVSATRSHVESFFRSVILLVRSVKMVLTTTQRERLTSLDLLRVKEIQGSAGAHIILDPQLDDIANTLSCFDIRLPYSDYFQRPSSLGNNQKLYSTGDAIGSAAGPAAPLIVVRITSRSGHQVEVAVIPSKISSWSDENTWNVRGLIMIMDSTAYARLNMDEKQKVDAGKVLINHDPITGRTVIRCKIQEYQHISERVIPLYHDPATDSSLESIPILSDLDAENQAGALIEAISDGLATSDALSLTRVALIIPTGHTSLCALSPDLIRTVAVESLVNFLKGAHLQYLQRIVCVDIIDVNSGGPCSSTNLQSSYPSRSSGGTTEFFSAAPKTKITNDTGLEMDSNEFALYPANGNRMALTLLLLLDQANRECQLAREDPRKQSYEPNNLMPLGRHERECFFRNIKGERKEEPEFHTSSSLTIQLLVCNIPLPCSLSAETVCPEIVAFEYQQRLRDKATAAAAASNSAYSGLGFLGNAQPLQPVDGIRYSRQKDTHRDQISDYRNHSENGPCVIVLRGLPIAILRAIRAIKQLVAAKL